MVVVEGVARTLDPQLNMWATSEPVVRAWIAENLGPRGRVEDASRRLASAAAFLADAPQRLEDMVVRLETAAAGRVAKQFENDISHSGWTYLVVGFFLALLAFAVFRWVL